MRTFFGKYSDGSFVYSEQNDALKAQLISILNTPVGSRFYAPTYGSHLNEYRFSIINYFTINMIGQCITDAVRFMNGVTLSKIEYALGEDNDLLFSLELVYMSDVVTINLKVADGVAS
jgi:phage baseplate assembly protein W